MLLLFENQFKLETFLSSRKQVLLSCSHVFHRVSESRLLPS